MAWSLALVASVEASIIVGAFWLRWDPVQATPDSPAVTVVFSPPAEPAPPPPAPVELSLSDPLNAPAPAEVPTLAPPPAVQVPSTLPRTEPSPRQRPRERLHPAEKPRVTQDTPQDAKPLARESPAPPAQPSAAAAATFDGLLWRAIQAAVRYPAAAQMMGLAGRARVAFNYRDGAVSAIRLEQSAGSPLLDNAALAAVRNAHYPAPLETDAGRTRSHLVWVELKPGDE